MISGYHPDAEEVHSIDVPDVPTGAQAPGTKKKSVVDLNTGIILAFMADAAVDATKKNPIGRLIEVK